MSDHTNPHPESWNCVDCGINTAPSVPNRAQFEAWNTLGAADINLEISVTSQCEVYHVHPKIWRKAGSVDGCLCIGCLERRLRRRLTAADFLRGHPLNSLAGTPRLLDRRTAWPDKPLTFVSEEPDDQHQ